MLSKEIELRIDNFKDEFIFVLNDFIDLLLCHHYYQQSAR